MSVRQPGVWLLAAAVFLLTAPRSFAASVTDEVQDELATQAESMRHDLRKPEAAVETPEVEAEEEPPAPPAEEGPRFPLRRIRVEGNTLFDEGTIRRFSREFEDRESSFGELRRFTDAITSMYRSHGYVTSRAFIPPQKLTDGDVTVRFLEGKVGRVFVEGNRHFKKSVYERELRLRPDRLLRYQDVESTVYFINRGRDRKAKAYLIAGELPGTTDLVLKVEEKNPIHMAYEYNNRGTKLTHRGRHVFRFEHNNVRGEGDTLDATATMAEEGAITGGGFLYNLTATQRLALQLEASLAETMLVREFKRSEIKGESFSISPGITYAFTRSPAFSVDGVAAFDVKESKTLVDDLKTSFDRIRALRAGPHFTWQDAGGRTLASAEGRWAFGDFLGSLSENDPNASRAGAGGSFSVYTASIVRLQRLPAAWAVTKGTYLILRGGGQWADEILPSSELYRIGGAGTVRGYPESDASGESGWNGSLEWDFPARFLGEAKVPFFPKTRWRDALTFDLFLDGGKAFQYERLTSGAVKDRFLLGAGGGLRFEIGRTVSLSIDYGVPIGDDSSDEDAPLVHFAGRMGF